MEFFLGFGFVEHLFLECLVGGREVAGTGLAVNVVSLVSHFDLANASRDLTSKSSLMIGKL